MCDVSMLGKEQKKRGSSTFLKRKQVTFVLIIINLLFMRNRLSTSEPDSPHVNNIKFSISLLYLI